MSDIGYRNKNQATVSVSVNSLSEYVRDLSRAIGPRSALRTDRRQGGRGIPATERQHPADRQRVLQLHPAETRRPLRRAADEGARAWPASNISKCARSMSVRSIRSASIRTSCASWRRFSSLPDSGQRADRSIHSGRAGCESSARRAPRPLAGPRLDARRSRGRHGRLGARTARRHAGHVRVAGPWRAAASVQAALDHQRAKIEDVARTPSARHARRNEPDRRDLHRARAAHVEVCTRITSWSSIRRTKAGSRNSPPRRGIACGAAQIESSDDVDFDSYLARYLTG